MFNFHEGEKRSRDPFFDFLESEESKKTAPKQVNVKKFKQQTKVEREKDAKEKPKVEKEKDAKEKQDMKRSSK